MTSPQLLHLIQFLIIFCNLILSLKLPFFYITIYQITAKKRKGLSESFSLKRYLATVASIASLLTQRVRGCNEIYHLKYQYNNSLCYQTSPTSSIFLVFISTPFSTLVVSKYLIPLITTTSTVVSSSEPDEPDEPEAPFSVEAP